ncbi:uncharacterized protein C8A04DRAFT_26093 [Dichotomopilus funicola]|uniref:Uncharacterized protein n=1 Tax=Dichotomopilus funicola TaxID=1934379 RepID=A0AAN6V9A2_9PEZI|nr:hypothetical protein C8A04DRAFT_26093 [Dichotomopilus funicola]
MVTSAKYLVQIAQAAATAVVLPTTHAILFAHANGEKLIQAAIDFGHHAAYGAFKYVTVHPEHMSAISTVDSGGVLDLPGVNSITVLGKVDFTPILQMAEQLVKLTQQLGHEIIEFIKEHPVQTVIIVAGVILIINPGGVAMPLLKIAGFGEGGVIGQSIASWIHSMIGNVSAGSLFALLQSAGAGGAGVNGAVTGIGITLTGLGAGGDRLASKL